MTKTPTLTVADKALRVDTALRTERDRLRQPDGDVRSANDLNCIVQCSDQETKARLYDLITTYDSKDEALASLSEPRKAMSPNFALFNCHVNDAKTRTEAEMAWSCPSWLAEVLAIEEAEGGIMAIMKIPPTPAIAAYLMLVTAYVNEDRV